jgi:uncharacterized OB-fold protein
MAYEKPLPKINADNRIFWEECKNHTLKIQKCTDCGKLRWPPAFLCPHCLDKKSQWVEMTGKGRVYTFAVYHTAFHPGFKEEVPYVVAVVELAEGPRMMSNIVDCDPKDVFCGMPVEVTWRDSGNQLSIPVFCPDKEPA